MDIIATITTLSKGLDLLKTLKEIDAEFDRASYKAQIAELMSMVAEAKASLLDARDDLRAKDAELAELKKMFEFVSENTVIDRGKRYERATDGSPQGMPFCDRCERVDGRLIRTVGTSTSKDGYKAICPQCKSDYGRIYGFSYPEDRHGVE